MNERGQRSSEHGLRIALAPGSIDGGGIGTVTLNLAEGLRDRGVQVDLLLTSEPQDGRAVPEGVRVIVLGNRTRYAVGAARRYFARNRPDAVISARNYMHLLTVAALWMAGHRGRCRHVWTFHTHRSTDLSSAGVKSRLVDVLAHRAIRREDRLVAVSQGVADDVEQALDLPQGRIRVIANPAWHSRYLERADGPAPHPWLEVGTRPVILGVGRLVAQKDFPTLIRAFAQLECSARLVILGEGPERPALEALVEKLGLEDRAILPGHVANVFAWLSRADLFVLSSRWEGLPTTIVEALGCGCPVVSTDCPSGPAEILRDQPNSVLVPVGDVLGVARGIAEAFSGPRPSPGNSLDRYSFDRAAEAYLDICMLDESEMAG